MPITNGADESVHFQVFLVVRDAVEEHMATQASKTKSKGDVAVLSSRAVTGFGGMVAVSAILLAVQFISGVQAFPL